MSTYHIPSMHKGQVNGSAKSKQTPDYQQKLSIAKNAVIKPNKNIATRPGLRAAGTRPATPGEILDILPSGDRNYILSKIDIDNDSDYGTLSVYNFLDKLKNPEDSNDIIRRITIGNTEHYITFACDVETELDVRYLEVLSEDFDTILEDEGYIFATLKLKATINKVTVDVSGDTYAYYRDEVPDPAIIGETAGLISETAISNLHHILAMIGQFEDSEIPNSTFSEGYVNDDTTITNNKHFHPSITTVNSIYSEQKVMLDEAGDQVYCFVLKSPKRGLNVEYQGITNIPDIDFSRLKDSKLVDTYKDSLRIKTIRLPHGESFDSSDYPLQNRIYEDRVISGGAVLDNAPPTGINLLNYLNRGAYINTREWEEGGALLDFKHVVTNDSTLPDKLEVTHENEGVGIYMFGSDYVLNRNLTNVHSGIDQVDSTNISQRYMATLTEKEIDKDLDNLPVLVTSFKTSILGSLSDLDSAPTNDTELNEIRTKFFKATGSLVGNPNTWLVSKEKTSKSDAILDLNTFIKENPKFINIKNSLKPALTLLKTFDSSNYYPSKNLAAKVLPDIKITVPGTDVPAEGTYLFSIDDEKHVFIGASVPLYYDNLEGTFRYRSDIGTDEFNYAYDDTGEEAVNKVLSPYLITKDDKPDSEKDTFQFDIGTGSAFGTIGVTLYIQTGNRLTKRGIPIYNPTLAPDLQDENGPVTDFDSTGQSNPYVYTTEVLYLTLDYDSEKVTEFINSSKYISFYASNGETKASAVSMVKSHNAYSPNTFSEKLASRFEYNYINRNTNFASDTYDTVLYILSIGKKDIDLEDYAATYIIDTNIRYDYESFPRVYLKNPNERDLSIQDILPKHKNSNSFAEGGKTYTTKPLVRVIGSHDVSNYFYPFTEDSLSDDYLSERDYANAISRLESIRKVLFQLNLPGYGTDQIFNTANVLRGTRGGYNYKLIAVDGEDLNYQSHWYAISYNNQGLGSASDFVVNRRGAFQRTEIWYRNVARVYYRDSSNRLQEKTNVNIKYQVVFVYFRKENFYKEFKPRPSDTAVRLYRHNFKAYYDAFVDKYSTKLKKDLVKNNFKPYSTNFTVYNRPKEEVLKVSNRFYQSVDGVLHLSSAEPKEHNLFSKAWKSFFRFVKSVLSNREFARRSGIPAQFIDDLDISTTDPKSVPFPSLNGKQATNLAYAKLADKDVVATDIGVFEIKDTGNYLQIDLLDSTTFTTNVIVNSSMLIGGDGDKLKALFYSDTRKGYISVIINDELDFGSEIEEVVDMLSTHKLVLIRLKDRKDVLYALSISEADELQGITEFNFARAEEVGLEINRIRRKDSNVIYLATNNGLKYMDFSDQINLADEVEEGVEGTHYLFNIRTLPVLQITQRNVSANKDLSIADILFGLSGFINFTLTVRNALNGKFTYTDVQRTTKDDPLNPIYYEGMLIQAAPRDNGCSQPEVDITKDDGRYLELSSMTLIGDY